MKESPPTEAWLEKPDGQRLPLHGNVSFGRTGTNQVVLSDEKVSRRHALIHPQGEHEFWLVDLGSRNGTYLNQRRLNQPVRLRDADRIQVGSFSFLFRQNNTGPGLASPDSDPSTLMTLFDVRPLTCWLLVVDVQSSTGMAQVMPPDQLATVMGRWILHCKELIESNGGTVNKYLGDGFLAYWRVDAVEARAVGNVLTGLRGLQESADPPFRFVLHHAQVTLGGVASLGEESLSGPAVNFVFRMEKLASSLHFPILLSESASTALSGALPTVSLGRHPVPNFEGVHLFFGL